MIYKIDFRRLFINLLPTFLRQPVIYGMLHAGAVVLGDTTYQSLPTHAKNITTS